MKIEKIIYDSARSLNNVEDKLSISVLVIFCYKTSGKMFAELLYGSNHKQFIERLTAQYISYDIDFSIRLDNPNVREAFTKTLDKVKEQYDANGYYKALHEGDPFALVIEKITEQKNKQTTCPLAPISKSVCCEANSN